MPRLASTEGDAGVTNGDEEDDKFSELPPVPPKFPVFESPPLPGEDIDAQPGPNTP